MEANAQFAKSPYRLAPSEMQELSARTRELQDKRNQNVAALSKRESETKTSRARKANEDDTDSPKVSESKAFKQENVLAERLHGLEQQMERKGDENMYFMDQIWVLLVGSVMDEAHVSRRRLQCQRLLAYCNSLRYLSENEIESPWILSLNFQVQSNNSKEWNSGDDQLRLRWMIYLVVLADAAESVRDAIGFEYCLASSSGWTNIRCAPFEALYGRKCRSPVLWAEIAEDLKLE
ncbi:hypothetical protein Tco_1210792 [Tanacetum coccineum]